MHLRTQIRYLVVLAALTAGCAAGPLHADREPITIEKPAPG